jgi:hypothetical protein
MRGSRLLHPGPLADGTALWLATQAMHHHMTRCCGMTHAPAHRECCMVWLLPLPHQAKQPQLCKPTLLLALMCANKLHGGVQGLISKHQWADCQLAEHTMTIAHCHLPSRSWVPATRSSLPAATLQQILREIGKHTHKQQVPAWTFLSRQYAPCTRRVHPDPPQRAPQVITCFRYVSVEPCIVLHTATWNIPILPWWGCPQVAEQ